MNKQLYRIVGVLDKVEIEEVNITRETEKLYYVSGTNLYRRQIRKADLDTVRDGYCVYTFDLNKGTKVWNDHIKTQIKYYEDQITRLKYKLITVKED